MQDIHHLSMAGGGGGGSGRFFGGEINGSGGGDRRLRAHQNHHSNHQALKCPRCNSLNTKFCYYNNYNLSQPRHFCKSCRRYWTKGGVLRNVPVGGGCRKAKRVKSKQSSSTGESAGEPAQDREDREGNTGCHSSSESSSLTASNSAAVVTTSVSRKGSAPAMEVATASSSVPNSGLYGYGIEWSALLAQGSPDGVICGEMGSYTNLIATMTNESMPFGFGETQQCVDHLKVEGETVNEEAEFPGRRSDQNVGFGPLDWGGSGGDQALFDLTSTVDHAYWSQSQWTADQDHNGLYLP